MVDRIFTPNKGEINGRIRSEKSGEGSYPENKSGQPKKTIIIESKKVFAASIKDFTTREGILAYLNSLKMVNTSKKNKHTGDELRKIAEQVFAGGSIYKVKSVPLREQLKIILKLEKEGAGSSAAVAEELFDAVDAALDKQEAEQLSAGGTEAASLEVESAPAEELSAASSGAEVKPPVAAEADPLEPGELEVGSLGVEVFPSEEGEEIRPEAIGPGKGPKPKKPEEGPEERERKARERQERLAQLKTEVEQARKEYLEDEYNKTKSYARLGSFFGKIRSILKDDSGEARDEYKRKKIEEDSDLAQYRAYYDNKLFEYKNLLLEDAKERGVSNKELGELVKVFAVEANLNMADTHANVKIEHRAGSTSETLKDSCMKMINWYRKLPPATKLAIGVGFLGAGAVAGYVGVGIGAVTTAAALRRFFMGAVTGTTVAVGLESWGRGKTEQGLEKMATSLSEGLEGRSDEERLRITQEIINKLIYDEDNKLNKIKNKHTRNLAIGIGAATLVGSASHWMGMLKNSETAQEIFGGIKGGAGKVMAMLGNQEGTIEGTGTYYDADAHGNEILEKSGKIIDQDKGINQSGASAAEATSAAKVTPGPGAVGAESHAEAPVGPVAENPVADAGETTVLKVEGGSSREGAIIEYLNEHPDAVEKYNELHGGRGFDSEDIAHRMAVDYANENSIPLEKLDDVLPGQELELSSDGTKIVSMPDIDSADYLLDEEIVDAPELEAETASPGQPELSHVDNFPEDSSGSDHPGNFSPEEDPHGYGLRHEEGLPEAGQETAGAHSEVPTEKAEAITSAPKEVLIEEFKLDDATSVKINSLNGRISDLHAQISEIDSQINHIAMGASYPAGDFPGRPGMVDELIEKKQFLEKSAADLIDKRDISYIMSIRDYVSGRDTGGDWDEIKNLRASQLIEDKKGLVYKFFAKISGENIVNFKGNINPGRGELLKDWVTRVVKMRTR